MLAVLLATVAFLKSKQSHDLSLALKNSRNVIPWEIRNRDGVVIGAGVPFIGKALYFADSPSYIMPYEDAMQKAMDAGRSLPTRKELMICYYFQEQINAIAEAAGHPYFLLGNTWSKDAWKDSAIALDFNSGHVFAQSKYAYAAALPIADL